MVVFFKKHVKERNREIAKNLIKMNLSIEDIKKLKEEM